MVNLNNAIHRYKGEPDRVEVVPFVGIGWHHTYGTVTNNIASKFGSQVNFNMGKEKKWQINVIPSINYIMTDNGFGVVTGQPRFDVHRATVNMQVGVTYKFKNHTGKHNFVHHHSLCKYKYTQDDYDKWMRIIEKQEGLTKNAIDKYNGLKKQLATKQTEIDKLNAREMTVVENVNVNSAVGFEIGKADIHYTQKAGLLNLVEMVKGSDTKLVVVGYADAKTGSKARNLKLSEMRANAVKKFLVDNGVKEENVTVEFKGDTEQMYSENEVNRVVVLTR
jgi:outer membrane protein OmpA-like peptidoglycan-associated protein